MYADSYKAEGENIFFFLNVAYVSEPILELQSYRVFEKDNAPAEKRINVVAKHE